MRSWPSWRVCPTRSWRRRSTGSFSPGSCRGRARRRIRLISSSTPWCRTPLTARCCASPAGALHARIAEGLELQFPNVAESQPELLARHCAQAGLIEKAAVLWGKAGQRSLARSALLEAEAHLTRALAEIAALPGTPALRREQDQPPSRPRQRSDARQGLRCEPRPKPPSERARTFVERAEALGEPSRRPVVAVFGAIMVSGLANYMAFNAAPC